jgi:hypothetical protein
VPLTRTRYLSRVHELLILVRLGGEVTIKSPRTRNAFLRRLRANMRDALAAAGIDHRIESAWGRLFVRTTSPMAVPVLARIFGISSLSVVEDEVPAEMDTILAAAARASPRAWRSHVCRACAPHGPHDFSPPATSSGSSARRSAARGRCDLSNRRFTVYVEVRDETGLPLLRAHRRARRPAPRRGGPGGSAAVRRLRLGRGGVAAAEARCRAGLRLLQPGRRRVRARRRARGKALADDWSYGTRRAARRRFRRGADELREKRGRRTGRWC